MYFGRVGNGPAFLWRKGFQQFNGCQDFLDIHVRSAYTFPVKINGYKKTNRQRDQLWGVFIPERKIERVTV